MINRDLWYVITGIVGLVIAFVFCTPPRGSAVAGVSAVDGGIAQGAQGAAPAPPVAPPPMPSVWVTFGEGKATVGGFVPDEKSRLRIVEQARRTWGATGVIDRITVDERVAGLDWYGAEAALAPFRVQGVPTGRIEFDGKSLVVSGQVSSADIRTNVIGAARKVAGKYPVDDRLVVAAAAVQKRKIDDYLASRRIEFGAGSATLTGEGRRTLDGLVPAMQEDRTTRLFVSGHTDNQGNAQDNERLSEARAQSVVDYLVARGVDKQRLVARGFGASQPVADNATDEGRRQNRRIEFQVRERGG